MSIKKGDKVSWVSHGRGSSVKNTGVVEVVVPAGKRPDVGVELKAGTAPRSAESYIIRIPGKTARSKSKLLWPHATIAKACARPAQCRSHQPARTMRAFLRPEKSGKAGRAARLDFQRMNATCAVSSPGTQDASLP